MVPDPRRTHGTEAGRMKLAARPALCPLLFVLLAVFFFLPVLMQIREAVVGAPTTPFTDGATQY
jgi:hypothetical protein